ncbi:MAG: hypothetical protein HC913_03165 [Microscillaceae bacterium]|nr:hypothetical protein [Microscillaceae bacterium]
MASLSGYLARWPRIVYSYQGDLYRVSSSGGTATALNRHPGHNYRPVWSPGGQQIATLVFGIPQVGMPTLGRQMAGKHPIRTRCEGNEPARNGEQGPRFPNPKSH